MTAVVTHAAPHHLVADEVLDVRRTRGGDAWTSAQGVNEQEPPGVLLGMPTLRTSADTREGLEELKLTLKDRATVLAGHSGVGKSSLIRAIQPQLDIRIGEVSEYTDKGRHTTTSARRYPLDFGGAVIDTPGVKQFGLWGITRERLEELFPDVANGSAPAWRVESYQRIAESLRE